MKCIWLTGLPCSGKTTIANGIKNFIGDNVQLLDGDIIRNTPLARNVGFTLEERKLHIERMGYLAKMFVDHDIYTICSFVSPLRETRGKVRKMFNPNSFKEIYVKASKEICIERDVKGMWAKALKGEIKNWTGLDSIYEEPLKPELIIDTEKMSIEESVRKIIWILK